MIVTAQQHILQQQEAFPEAGGTFSWLLSGITLATKMIQAKIRQAGFSMCWAAPVIRTCRVRRNKNWTFTLITRCCIVWA